MVNFYITSTISERDSTSCYPFLVKVPSTTNNGHAIAALVYGLWVSAAKGTKIASVSIPNKFKVCDYFDGNSIAPWEGKLTLLDPFTGGSPAFCMEYFAYAKDCRKYEVDSEGIPRKEQVICRPDLDLKCSNHRYSRDKMYALACDMVATSLETEAGGNADNVSTEDEFWEIAYEIYHRCLNYFDRSNPAKADACNESMRNIKKRLDSDE
ncbi:MAG: hypothetical protein ACPGO7_01090 [Alphaproteobacteria bacterium]